MAKDGGSSLITLGILAVGGYFAYEYFFGGSAPVTTTAAAPAGTTPVAGSPVPVTQTAVPATIAPSQLDSIYNALKAAAQPDQQFTGSGDSLTGLPFHWDFYLQRVVPQGTTIPADPFTDVNTPISAPVYWASVAPLLKAANPGLGGLGVFAGLGCFACAMNQVA